VSEYNLRFGRPHLDHRVLRHGQAAGEAAPTHGDHGLPGFAWLSDVRGDWATGFLVKFGPLPGGGFSANVTTGGSGINAADAALVDAIVNSKGNGSTNRAMARK